MIDLDAIRARDAEMGDADVRFVRKSLADRRALLQYVDELRKAARKVTCRTCSGNKHTFYSIDPFPDCADLRRYLGEP